MSPTTNESLSLVASTSKIFLYSDIFFWGQVGWAGRGENPHLYCSSSGYHFIVLLLLSPFSLISTPSHIFRLGSANFSYKVSDSNYFSFWESKSNCGNYSILLLLHESNHKQMEMVINVSQQKSIYKNKQSIVQIVCQCLS